METKRIIWTVQIMTCQCRSIVQYTFLKYCPIQVSSCSHLALCSGCQTVILCKSFPSKDNSLINPSLETVQRRPWPLTEVLPECQKRQVGEGWQSEMSGFRALSAHCPDKFHLCSGANWGQWGEVLTEGECPLTLLAAPLQIFGIDGTLNNVSMFWYEDI